MFFSPADPINVVHYDLDQSPVCVLVPVKTVTGGVQEEVGGCGQGGCQVSTGGCASIGSGHCQPDTAYQLFVQSLITAHSDRQDAAGSYSASLERVTL